MAATPQRIIRVAPELESAARRGPHAHEVAGLDFATLARVGLAVLAGHKVAEAIALARTRPGPKPRRGNI